MRDASTVRAEVFEDTDLSRDLKLFTLAAFHLYEHADEYKRVKQFRRSSWPYRALRLAGWSGTDEELNGQLRRLIGDDVPKYRPDMRTWPACVGVMLRPAGTPCKAKVGLRAMIVNPLTGERTYSGACSRHRAVFEAQLRQARQAWEANGKPQPAPNSGGRLLRYFTKGITDLYAWADKDYKPGDAVPVAPDRPLAAVIDIAAHTRSNT